jgi:hypothetical protein
MIAELGQKIYDARGEQADRRDREHRRRLRRVLGRDCSADEVGVTPVGEDRVDRRVRHAPGLSARARDEGIKPTTIQYGKYKTELHPYGPLSATRRSPTCRASSTRWARCSRCRRARPRRRAPRPSRELRPGPHAAWRRTPSRPGWPTASRRIDEMLARLARGKVKSGKPSAMRRRPAPRSWSSTRPRRRPVDAAASATTSSASCSRARTRPRSRPAQRPVVIELQDALTPAHLEQLT